MKYNDIDPRKQAFVFELDNVLYPEKDYLFQVYYLFANMLEYTELWDAKAMTALMTNTYAEKGHAGVFDTLKEKFNVDERYRTNLEDMLVTSRLPLKLLLYQNMLTLLQDIVVDRKKIFILTNGNPQQQLNKIKQTEWNGLESYLTCYFADEIRAKPEPDALNQLIAEHKLNRRDVVMVGNSSTDEFTAEAAGVDYYKSADFVLNFK
ncbi:HAD family hydrolase [Mucilaginibacter limnophilus]|uniref:HAD family hydrolase n=1 Tax=Mucilaginibacter limnophilus TaxID=1932778 RepID=A0A3S2UNP1_9SPHI|nr:HAD hydrolase-like protein [Mucilaginibacter limnophilus]RVU02943.1 HAD family hydrolase [Mucilaginibacter limnophilus]